MKPRDPIQALVVTFWVTFSVWASAELTRPNILWITSEDNGPYLGCYGDPIARTPNLDALAKSSTRYLNCFSNAAVCAPARQTLISGMYATSLGGQHMRSKATFPDGVEFFPKFLRDSGYYTSNNSKTDYNGGPADGAAAMKAAWNESSKKAHWKNRPNPETPFFAVFNFTDSHESNLFPARWKNRELKTDPATVKLPEYLPDLPETRLDLARYYDCLEVMDQKVGNVLRQLEEDGLADNTIVFYYADHGGSMPRGKSFAYDSGTRVPLLIRFPETWARFRPSDIGDVSDRLVSFVDFAPTVLSLAGVEIPTYMQGHAFLGATEAPERDYVHVFRARRGERYDIVRGVRNRQFLYLRNYTPHLPVLQFNAYSFAIPGYGAWQAAWERGDCNPAQAQWFEPKSSEELYQIADDPDNVRNLATNADHRATLEICRKELSRHLSEIRDSAFFPEGMSGRNYAAYQDDAIYPLAELIPLADAVSEQNTEHLPTFQSAINSENACLRYWAVTGCVALGEKAKEAKPELVARLEDTEPAVQLQAARALAGIGEAALALSTIRQFTENAPNQHLELQAVLAIDECDLLAVDPSLEESLKRTKGSYTKRVVEKLRASQAERAASLPIRQTVRKIPESIAAKTENLNDQFWLYLPKQDAIREQQLPLIIYLHGSSRRGHDIHEVKANGLPPLLDAMDDFDFVVASPQALSNYPWQTSWRPDDLILLLDYLLAEFNIDPDRVYLTGLSMGGYGTWACIGKHAERFAAAAPICGGGDPKTGEAIGTLPIWAFHGEEDRIVPHERSREMVEAVNAVGGNARLTSYPGVGHDSFTQTYANPKLYEWFRSQVRDHRH